MSIDAWLLAFALTFGLLIFLHWFTWPAVLGGHDLPRLIAYSLGTGVIVGVTTLVARLNPQLSGAQVITLLWGVTLTAGVVVAGSWGLRWVINAHHRGRERDEQIKSRRDGE